MKFIYIYNYNNQTNTDYVNPIIIDQIDDSKKNSVKINDVEFFLKYTYNNDNHILKVILEKVLTKTTTISFGVKKI